MLLKKIFNSAVLCALLSMTHTSSVHADFNGFIHEDIYSIGVSEGPVAVVVGQFTNSGFNDIAVLSYNSVQGASQVDIYFGSGTGKFVTTSSGHKTINLPSMIATSMILGSFNGASDSSTSIAVAGSSMGSGIIQIIANGAGASLGTLSLLSNPIIQNNVGAFHGITTNPFNSSSNGYNGLAVTGNDNNVYVYFGNGDNSFGVATRSSADVVIPVGNLPLGIISGIFTSSKYSDIVVANNQDSTITFIPGAAKGKFGLPVILPSSGLPVNVVSGDFNGDGFLDIATSSASIIINNNIDNITNVFFGDGNGNFTHSSPIILNSTISTGHSAIAAGNFSNHPNNQSDIMISVGDNIVLLSNSNGNFSTTTVPYDVGNYPTSFAIGTLKTGGPANVVVANQNNYTFSVLTQNIQAPNLKGKLSMVRYGGLNQYNFSLSWDLSSMASLKGYYLYRNGILIKTLDATGTSYIDSTVLKGATYTYQLVAFDTSNNMTTPSSLSLTVQ